MCGIAGIVGTIESKTEETLSSMLAAQVHRGPDDHGTYQYGGSPGVRFGFRRLAILDLTVDGHQPMVDQATGNAIVFNGEIYNFAELRAELESEGLRFRSKCDTEVLLQAYGRYGTSVLSKLRGMYAFAIHDVRRNMVFLARDRLGIKPLYYAEVSHRDDKTLIFASELRSLLATRLIEPRLDPVGLSSYFWNGFVVGPNTIIKGISLLPPGTSMTIDVTNGHTSIERYWALGTCPSQSPEAARQELQSELLTAARQHLISDVPLGIFLSGGVDSSAVASLAVRAASSKVKTFHIGFDEAAYDESAYARRVANALQTEHAEFRLTQAIFVSQLEQALASIDQPTFDAINTYFVSRVVREAGFTVALAGTGGDELFGGYQSFRNMSPATLGARWLGRLPVAPLGRALQQAAEAIYGRDGNVTPQSRWAKLGALLTTRGDPVNVYQVFYSLFLPEFLKQLSPLSHDTLAPFGLPAARIDELRKSVAGQSALSATSTLELALFIGERLLRDSDAASMAVSLELRVPLLDHKVVEKAQAVPDSQRFSPLGRKQLLRSLAMPQLDSSLFDRPKAGFVLPISVWAKDRLADDIESTFANRTHVESVGLNAKALSRLWRTFKGGGRGMYWSRVWAPYVLLNWCRTHGVTL